MASKMKERPILFTKENRQKGVNGLKTQTRRIINFKKIAKQTGCAKGKLFYSKTFDSWAVDGNNNVSMCLVKAPYAVGDRLYQLEPYQITYANISGVCCQPRVICGEYLDNGEQFDLQLTEAEWKKFINRKKPYMKTSARFMYKSLARYWYVVTGVGVEQVQDICLYDCYAEGIQSQFSANYVNPNNEPITPLKGRFQKLWNSIHGQPKPLMKNSRLAKLLLDNETLNRIAGNIACYVSYPWEDVQETRTYRGRKWFVMGNPGCWVDEFKRIDK